jgi:signal peptidase I
VRGRTTPVVGGELRLGARNIGGEGRAGDPLQIRSRLQHRGRVCLRVQGSSMLPWVRPGDMVFVESAASEEVRCGDVVLFERGGRLFAHRLIGKRGDLSGFITKGDAHPNADPCLPASALLGRVARIQRGGKRIHLNSRFHTVLAAFLSLLSRHSKLWYPAARIAFHLAQPVRRFFLRLRPSGAQIH